ncbi:unnamed protein product [Lathyrus sativus]|nr:unnamed protein product [Lathyrus sativus]
MEAMKINQFFISMVVVAMMMAASSVSAVEAPTSSVSAVKASAPAPGPTSDATTLFVPTIIASFVALVFGFIL